MAGFTNVLVRRAVTMFPALAILATGTNATSALIRVLTPPAEQPRASSVRLRWQCCWRASALIWVAGPPDRSLSGVVRGGFWLRYAFDRTHYVFLKC